MLPGDDHLAARPGQDQYIIAEHAARCLVHLAETGRVDWRATDPARAG